jgi:hypothetical protein
VLQSDQKYKKECYRLEQSTHRRITSLHFLSSSSGFAVQICTSQLLSRSFSLSSKCFQKTLQQPLTTFVSPVPSLAAKPAVLQPLLPTTQLTAPTLLSDFVALSEQHTSTASVVRQAQPTPLVSVVLSVPPTPWGSVVHLECIIQEVIVAPLDESMWEEFVVCRDKGMSEIGASVLWDGLNVD